MKLTILTASLLLATCAVSDKSFFETFQYPSLSDSGWKKSNWEQAGGEWSLSKGSTAWHGHDDNDFALIVESPAQRHAISKHLEGAVDPHGSPELVIQYDVRFHNHMECGGAYLKALSVPEDLSGPTLDADTSYSIMFGPDKCGATDKVHFIIKHRSPITEKWTEHHAKNVPAIVNDRFTHQYRLELFANNTYIIKIDDVVKSEGNLLSAADFEPPLIPSETIPDPDDKKPETWNDVARIPDPTQTKPEDWDEDQPKLIKDESAVKPADWDEDAPLKIPDPEAQQPDDWDEEDDGEWKAPLVDNPSCEQHGCGPWTAPLIPNPLYKGKWKPDMIDNPDYDGIWAPRQIPNPDYFTTDDATKGMAMITDVAFEIWTMQNGIEFDNIYVGHSIAEADKFTQEFFQVKKQKEVEAHAAIAPKDTAAADDAKDSSWFNQQFQSTMNALSPYLETVSSNPLPFIFTSLSGLLVFAVYMYKQAGQATAELMQQAKASKAAIEKNEPKSAPVDKDEDDEDEEESDEDDE